MKFDILPYLQNPSAIATLLGIVSFIVSLPFLIISLFQRDKFKTSLKITGTCFVISLSFLANNTIVYALAIFIVATFITKLDFLENIAAIFWGRSEFWEYKASLSKATPVEVQNKIDDEIKQKPILRKPSETIVSMRTKALQFETSAIAALKTSMIFPQCQIRTQVRLRVGQRVRYVIDAIVYTPKTNYIIEIKSYYNTRILERTVDQVQDYMKAYIAFKIKNHIIPNIKGIIVIPSRVSVGDDLIRGIAILKFDLNSDSFTNTEVIKKWILNDGLLYEESFD